MTAYGNMDEALSGLLYGTENEIVSRVAAGEIQFGSPVFVREGNGEQCIGTAEALVNGVAAVFNLALTGTATEDGDITVTVGAQDLIVAVATDDTAAEVAAAVVAAATTTPFTGFVTTNSTGTLIFTASATGAGPNTTAISATVPAGLSAAEATLETDGVDAEGVTVLLGVAVRTDKRPGYYAVGDAVNILVDGLVWVPTGADTQANTAAYLTGAEVWTPTAGGNTATNNKFRRNALSGGLVLMEVK